TAKTMQPILETRNAKDKANPSIDVAIKRLDNSFAAGKLPWVSRPYWRKDADGKSWLGRGLVQLTHKVNYDRLGKIIGVDLIADPDKAMDPGIAISIMFFGMTSGAFTGRPLSDYLDGPTPDYVNARRVINGIESARKVADYAVRFEQALVAAGYSNAAKPVEVVKPSVPDLPPRAEPSGGGAVAAPAVPVDNVDPEKLDKPLLKSKTVWQWIITTIVVPLVALITNPWVQAFLIAVVAGFAVYAIKRRADIAKVYRDLKAEFDA
ncbi:glycoside hydrolase family 19 protein, partial [Agrobacterium pusense]|uniref:glycoside hydrolase family 19 protein n=1 Tax=Agrobacterium pusense TaxID=648995 RepID=UPI0028A840A5